MRVKTWIKALEIVFKMFFGSWTDSKSIDGWKV